MKQGAGQAIDGATVILANELPDEPENPPNGAQQKAQHFGEIETPQHFPDAARLIELWPILPEPVRRSILVLAEQFGEL